MVDSGSCQVCRGASSSLSIYAFSKNADRKKLLWLLPLVLFAFTFPVAYAFLWLAFMWEAAHGRAVP